MHRWEFKIGRNEKEGLHFSLIFYDLPVMTVVYLATYFLSELQDIIIISFQFVFLNNSLKLCKVVLQLKIDSFGNKKYFIKMEIIFVPIF